MPRTPEQIQDGLQRRAEWIADANGLTLGTADPSNVIAFRDIYASRKPPRGELRDVLIRFGCLPRSQHTRDEEIAARRADDERHSRRARLADNAEEMLAVLRVLALATDEGDDAAQGTHYVAKDGRIRCKGSFLETIERARTVIAKIEEN